MSNDLTVFDDSTEARPEPADPPPASATSVAAPNESLTPASTGHDRAAPDDEQSTTDATPVPRRWRIDPATVGRVVVAPLVGILAFLMVWAILAPRVETSLGTLPGPAEVWDAGVGLYDDWQAERDAEARFYADQDVRNAELIDAGRESEVTDFTYAGSPTFPDQIWTSLRTVALGFLIGSLVAIPLGLLAGLSRWFSAAINPLVQIFRPVSPLAWLPIVTMVVAATVTSNDPLLPKAFIISAIVVALNSLWPTLINTGVGAASVDQDLLNVAKVLRLGWFTKLRKVVLPSALPYIFTGLRLSLGVGWMVLIAAEMLAQNPGLGKFVWDEFQNGSSESLSRIMFAVFVIGIIGFALDRLMSALEKFVGRNHTS
ncbi:MAG: ABC transporter permease [Actinomycetota bacterium]